MRAITAIGEEEEDSVRPTAIDLWALPELPEVPEGAAEEIELSKRVQAASREAFLNTHPTLAYINGGNAAEAISNRRLYRDLYPKANSASEKMDELTRLSGDLTALHAGKSTALPPELLQKIEAIQTKYGISILNAGEKSVSELRVSQLKSTISDYVDTEKTLLNSQVTDIQKEIQLGKMLNDAERGSLRDNERLMETISKNMRQ